MRYLFDRMMFIGVPEFDGMPTWKKVAVYLGIIAAPFLAGLDFSALL